MQKMGSPPSPHISLLAESTVEPFPDSMGSVKDITNIFLVQLQLLLLRIQGKVTKRHSMATNYSILFCFVFVWFQASNTCLLMQKMESTSSPRIALLGVSTDEPLPDSVESVNNRTNIFLIQLQLLLLRI